MKRDLSNKIEIPEGVHISIEGNGITIKGKHGENKKKFNTQRLEMKKEGNYIMIGAKKATKREKKMINTITAHIKNMIHGVKEGFEYKLKICFSHFPIIIDIDKEKKQAFVKNFLGEKVPRKLNLLDGADIEIKGQDIIIKSHDKEIAGQMAANFEKATRILLKDRRIFQDGIFITSKAGEAL